MGNNWKTDETLECEELCSKYCPGKYAFVNNVCEDECNTVECKHDNGGYFAYNRHNSNSGFAHDNMTNSNGLFYIRH